MESLVTDHPPSPTDKGLELLVGGVGLSAPHLVLSAALNRQKQPWFGQKWPSTPHLPPEPRKAKWRSGWGLEKRGLGRPRGGLCWRPKVLQGAHSVCTSKGVLQKNRTGRKYRLGVGWGWRERERATLRNWLTSLWRLASLKSSGWAGRLETQGGLAIARRQSGSRIPSSLGPLSLFPEAVN